jgi:acetyl esterase
MSVDGSVREEDRDLIARTRVAMSADAVLEVKEPVDLVRDLDAGGVPSRLYAPADARDLLIYLHGGGFVYGDRGTHDGIARRLANRTGWSVLLVDYRRAPDHPCPAAVDDTRAAADWAIDQAAADGWNRIALIGDSAGGNLVLGEALRRPGRYAALCLVYPFLDPTGDSYDAAREDPDLTLAEASWYWQQYLQGSDCTGAHPERGDLGGAPPTLIQLAERDVLYGAGRALALRLAQDGVPAQVQDYPGVTHGFWRHTDNDQSEPALAAVAAFLADPATQL